MKHLVNVGLLFFFATLLATGLMRFLQPFSLTVTRVHITFGLGMTVLIGLHLSSRGNYFRSLLRPPPRPSPSRFGSRSQAAAAAACWSITLMASLWNLWPVDQLIGSSYEARHAREIFRPHRRVAHLPVASGLRVHRGSETDTALFLEFDWGPAFGHNVDEPDLSGVQTQLAIWAENEEGDVLETLFVSEALAASDTMRWGGHEVRRKDVLPVWHARYEKLLGETPQQDLDAVSAATPTRDFSMEGHFETDGLPFALYAEVNAAQDSNATFRPSGDAPALPPGVGQPSVVYEARIYPSDLRRYYLMELVGHGLAGVRTPGDINYDLTGLTTARRLIDKALIKVTWPEPDPS